MSFEPPVFPRVHMRWLEVSPKLPLVVEWFKQNFEMPKILGLRAEICDHLWLSHVSKHQVMESKSRQGNSMKFNQCIIILRLSQSKKEKTYTQMEPQKRKMFAVEGCLLSNPKMPSKIYRSSSSAVFFGLHDMQKTQKYAKTGRWDWL